MEWKKWTYEFAELNEYLERIQAKKNMLDIQRPLHTYALRNIREAMRIEWTYNSNSIEGNTLSLRETQMVVEEGMTIKGKSLREHFEAVNHQDAIEYVEKLISAKSKIYSTDILETHSLVLQKIEKEFAGRYRNAGVRISGANFVPPNALKVDQMMDELLDWVNLESADLHPLLRATIFHHRFVWIHPFFDGNGRTARLIFNLLLMREGYPPAIILSADRKKYYDALNRCNLGDYSKLLLLIIQASERTLDIYTSSLNNTHDDYMSITNVVKEADIHYGQEYVSLLARRGKIDAYKEGKNWVTTKKAIKEYVTKRKRNRVLN